uniref:Envelope glycoprotein n=1 Tax=Strix occidentalis caurina TaxID=311401 RepID=A0A8D0KY05_STROC
MHKNMSGILVLLYLIYIKSVTNDWIHQPFEWLLARFEDSIIIRKVITSRAPTFNVTNCDILSPTLGSHCNLEHQWSWGATNLKATYWCPSSNPGRSYFNSPGYFYCAYWGCETIATAWDVSEKDKYLKVGWSPERCETPTYDYSGGVLNAGNCKNLTLTIQKPEEPGWVVGRTWGVMLREPGTYRGGLILIQKRPVLLTPKPKPVGPNKVITNEIGQNKTVADKIGTNITNTQENITALRRTRNIQENITALRRIESNPLWRLVQTAYQALNRTNPNTTLGCWLCYDVRPPLYEGIGLNVTYSLSNEASPEQCKWNKKKIGLTMQQVRGQGTCIGKVPRNQKNLCGNKIQRLNKAGNKWAIPREGGWWICSKTGLTPCLSLTMFNENKEFCIQITVMPWILYHPKETVFKYWNNNNLRIRKREPLTALTIATLIGLGTAGAATGITSLVQQHKGLSSLRAAVDEDLERIEKSISLLEKSPTSLSEVVLQNRRGLDLLFLQQGGLCVALGEECCFYADHSGVVRESMTELREGIIQRKKEREAQQHCFESWFNQSPWMTTLIATLIGPLIILLLILTFGPCILNKLINLVKNRIETVQLMILRQQYTDLTQQEEHLLETELEDDTFLGAAKEAIFKLNQQIEV